jgi:hypothetical protein
MTEANAVAWELAELVGPHIGRAERAELYVSIGSGETLLPTGYLMAAVVRLRLSVPDDVIEKCVAWLEGYVGHDAESSLRELVAQFRTSTRIQPSPPQLQRRFLSVAARYRHARSNSISPEAPARSDCR